MKHVTLFCGSKSGTRKIYAEAASRFGTWVATSQSTLVYGGGNVGLMGIAADAVLQAGGSVIGVITHSLMELEVGHQGLTRLEKTQTMAERKTRLIELADLFLILPGGFGTLDEMYEALTLSQLGEHKKPVLLVNLENYYSDLLKFTARATSDQFLDTPTAELLHSVDSIEEMLAWLENWQRGQPPRSRARKSVT